MALRYGRSRLPELLKGNRCSQVEFARKIGISEAYVSQIISGARRFTFIHAVNAARILDCNPIELYEWEEV